MFDLSISVAGRCRSAFKVDEQGTVFLRGSVLKITAAIGVLVVVAQSAAAQDDVFFEREVRPILVEHCQSCHGAKKQEMSLRLDSADGLKLGGDSGAVVVAGEPDRSRLIEVIRYAGDIKMPPKGKLPAAAIAALEKGVQSGAHWPKSAAAVAGNSIRMPTLEEAKGHWSFQPIREPPVPTVNARDRMLQPVDAFVLQKLEAVGLTLSPAADRRTLIRRVTFDLHGLPPTPEDVSAFEQEQSPDAYRLLVERLLKSPRYGERWGRHWLDVARYSDTKGYVRLNENPRYPASWTYRDYVVKAFNDDLPFDRFVIEQLAADQLQTAEQKSEPSPALAALGFLTLGQRYLNSTHDIIDDRIDVVTRGLLGMTATCARCHDHKFDPIPTRDYYSLHGVFMSSAEPRVPPLILPTAEHGKFEKYLSELKRRSQQLDGYLKQQQAALGANFRSRLAEYLLAGYREPVQPNFLAVMFLIDAKKDLNPVLVQRWARFFDRTRKRHDPVFAPWQELAQLSSMENFPQRAIDQMQTWPMRSVGDGRLNAIVVAELRKSPPQSLADVAATYARLLQRAETQPTPESEREAWAELSSTFAGADAPLSISLDDVEEFLFVDATTQQQLHGQQRLVTDWIASPDAAPHAMSLEDVLQPTDSRVLIRGNASNPGETVPRQLLAVLSRGEQRPFRQGSGRLELAQAIASADNPLTARVLVNRVWQQHFGIGLVRTASDFGLRGERPSHPELLDHLASRFMAQGWSIKQLHRDILLSATYRQRSAIATDAALRAKDPDNVWLWSMPRRRLDWEAMRDALVFVTGQLDLTMGGPSVNLFAAPYSNRRSVYGFIDRQNLPSELRTFDFAPPDSSSSNRHQTTVPQQALFLMNSPFMKQQVQQLAARLAGTPSSSDEQRLESAYRLLFARSPRADEQSLALSFLKPAAASGASNWEELLQVLLLSNEFVFVD